MYRHLMIDLETLGAKPNSPVIAIGAVPFNPEGEDSYDTLDVDDRIFYVNLEYQSQLDMGRPIQASAVNWWMKQSNVARAQAFPAEAEQTPKALLDFHRFATWVKADYLWGNGSAFDNVILESLFSDYGLPWMFDFRNYRDLRTLKAIAGIAPIQIPRGTVHNALADAQYQVLCAQHYYRPLRSGS